MPAGSGIPVDQGDSNASGITAPLGKGAIFICTPSRYEGSGDGVAVEKLQRGKSVHQKLLAHAMTKGAW